MCSVSIIKFPCAMCGLCCQHVDRSPDYSDLDRGDGTCRFYDDATRKCRQYQERPLRCNIDLFYEQELQELLARDEYYDLNLKVCRELWQEAVMADKWISIGKLKTADLAPYNHCIGLYRHKVNGRIMYIGRAIEYNNGGFRKRLSDYRRNSDSARKHTSGQIINQHLDEIETEILIVGDSVDAVEQTKMLEKEYIARYNPAWNKQCK